MSYESCHLFIESKGEVWIRITSIERYIAIEIRDTGCGISDVHMPHIFETFFRADSTGTTRGLGLGLSIVKLIVDMHHGEIEVESDEGMGSIFRILLPDANTV